MSRWTNTDAFIKSVVKSGLGVDFINNVTALLIDTPTINLILYKECRYVVTDATCCLVCDREGMGLKPFHVYPDDFCSYGCRKESK